MISSNKMDKARQWLHKVECWFSLDAGIELGRVSFVLRSSDINSLLRLMLSDM